MKKLFKIVVNVEKVLKMVKNGDFSKFVKNGEMLKNVGEIIKKFFAVIFFYTMDIKNTIFNPKFYQHFLPSLNITMCATTIKCATNKLRKFNVRKFNGCNLI